MYRRGVERQQVLGSAGRDRRSRSTRTRGRPPDGNRRRHPLPSDPRGARGCARRHLCPHVIAARASRIESARLVRGGTGIGARAVLARPEGLRHGPRPAREEVPRRRRQGRGEGRQSASPADGSDLGAEPSRKGAAGRDRSPDRGRERRGARGHRTRTFATPSLDAAIACTMSSSWRDRSSMVPDGQADQHELDITSRIEHHPGVGGADSRSA